MNILAKVQLTLKKGAGDEGKVIRLFCGEFSTVLQRKGFSVVKENT